MAEEEIILGMPATYWANVFTYIMFGVAGIAGGYMLGLWKKKRALKSLNDEKGSNSKQD